VTAPGSRAGRSGRIRPAWLAAFALLPGAAGAQPPLFAFAQISDIQADEPEEVARLDLVLQTLAAAGAPGALLPHPVAAVFLAGDLVEAPGEVAEWDALASALASGLSVHGIPFLAVPGNHDQDEFGPVLYEERIAPAGVWDASSADLRGQNGLATATGWAGLRFVGLNSSHHGWNTVRAAEMAQVEAIAAAAAAAGENVFLVAHHPHDDLGPIPLVDVLEIPGVVGYMRGHGGSAHASSGLEGIANPVWDLSSHSVNLDAALIYYEAFPTEIRAYVLHLVANPQLPPPAVLPLPHALWPAAAPSAPVAAFAAAPRLGRAPLEVAFADLSTGQPSGWLWDFGDGATSAERHPIHVYQEGGAYDVSLVADNAQGPDSSTEVAAVEVLPPFPSATFGPVADARVSSESPTETFGTQTTLRARSDATSSVQSYLRFAVDGLDGRRLLGAVLRLYVTDPSVEGGTLSVAPGGWDEATLSWANAPGVGTTLLDSVGTAFPGTWVEFDVSAVVTAPGTYDFGLSSSASNAVVYSSREGAEPPQLVVFTAPVVPVLGPAGRALLAALLVGAGARSLSGRARRSRSFGAGRVDPVRAPRSRARGLRSATPCSA
jgi:PKD repeat protein